MLDDKATKKERKEWPRTITPELLAAWQKLKRKKDAEIMAKELKYSRPVIDRALIFGFVSMPELTDKICNFFSERLNQEKKEAARLMTLNDEVQQQKK